MLLTLTYTPDGSGEPATELGFLLHKHPARVQTFELSFGQAHVYYPEATAARCTAALQLEVDPVALSRPAAGHPSGYPSSRPLAPYVNDRPYVASSFMSVALSEVFGAALQGRSKERPQLADRPLLLRARLAVLSCRGGEPFFRRLFEPLGYQLDVVRHPLDEQHPEWGPSRYLSVTLSARKRLRELLGHLYVLIPVLDDDKHYYVGESEVEKLLRYGEGWLAEHPERHQITLRYLKHRRTLAHQAMGRLVAEQGEDAEAAGEPDAPVPPPGAPDAPLPAPERQLSLSLSLSLDEQRLSAVLAELVRLRARRVLDLGCGEAKLLRALLLNPAFTEIVGVDVSVRALQIAADRLRLEQLSEKQRGRITLLHGSLTYRDKRLVGFDAAAVVEVIEHLPPERLPAFERAVFSVARPRAVVLTTPNAEYNVRYPQPHRFRHSDHRFEWSRAELAAWARGVGERHGYTVTVLPIGEVDPELGAPTQMAVFERPDAAPGDAPGDTPSDTPSDAEVLS